MLVRLSAETWRNIIKEVFYKDGLLDNGYIKPQDAAEYLSEQPINIDFNKMVQVSL